MSNYPTLDGLNSIDADSGNLTNITCETFIATTSAQVPTMIAGDNSTNVANTEFVTDAVSTATANLVTTNTSQTIALGAVKTFLTLPQSSATVSNNEDLVTKKYVDDNYINIIGDQTLSSGIKFFNVLPQSSATPSDNKDFTTKKYTDDNFVGLTGVQNISSIKTFVVPPRCAVTSTDYDELVNKSYVDNAVGGLTGTYVGLTGAQNISSTKTFLSVPKCSVSASANDDLVNKLYVDNAVSGATGSTGIFVTLSGPQTINDTKTFSSIPKCSVSASANDDLVNKLYVDNAVSGVTGSTGIFVTLSGAQLINDIKTFDVPPRCAVTATDYDELVNKNFVDNSISGLTGTYVGLTGAQNISGVKSFLSVPKCSVSASANDDIVNKLYVDNAVAGVGTSYVGITGNQIIYDTKTFIDLPECTQIPSNNADLVNKKFVDDNFLSLVGSQTVSSGTVKTFLTLPQSSTVPSANADMVNKLYVDNAVAGVVGATGTFVTLSGNQTISSGTVKTFLTLPESSATPSTANQLVPKNYVDNNFLNLSGAQTVTGNKTFTGNNIIEGATGTNIIRGNQVDIYPTVTFLTSPTTTISGTYGNFQSTNNYIAGTTTTLASTTVVVNNTCNSFYVDASYSNFVGDETLLQSPYTVVSSLCNLCEVNPVTLRLQSPTIDLQNTCSNFYVKATNTTFTGTNTDLTGTNATAFTQISSDNSTKIATTAFVNAHTLANYMTTNTNQSVSGIKTYSTKQVFNAGISCNTYDATGITDMTLANNNGDKGILTIADGRIITDSYGVKLAANNRNLQLGDGTFIQAINQEGLNDYSKPTFVFASNRTQGYTDITGVPNSAQATRQINILQGISSWFAGYNQTTTFVISHSIFTTSSTALASMNEAEVVIYFQDFNTGIVRYTSPNLATTTAFALPANSTVIRPLITFTLTTAQLPEGEYLIMGYSRVTNAYAVNTGVLTVNFSYAGATSTDTAVQNYNTPTPSTFTSRNLYHCFRNTAMVGVYVINKIGSNNEQNIPTPIHYSISDFNNMMFQPSVSGSVSTPAVTGGSAVGNFVGLTLSDSDNIYIVYPNYSLIVYDNTGWSGTVYVNFKNTGLNPVTIAPTTQQRGSSCRIYFDEVELIKY
jgi:hypothetical protein